MIGYELIIPIAQLTRFELFKIVSFGNKDNVESSLTEVTNLKACDWRAHRSDPNSLKQEERYSSAQKSHEQ
jgi:hypothetical protein